MKRFSLVLVLCGLMAAPSLAVGTFTPSFSDLQGFADLAAPLTQDADYEAFGVFLAPGADPGYGSLTMQGIVGYHATDVGAAGTLDFVGVGKGGFDLTDYDTFALVIANDNNQGWQYRLFADDGTTTNFSGDWVTIINGDKSTLAVDLAGLTLDDVTLGFQVGRSDQADNFHTSVSPIPAPGAILLAGIGAGVIGWMRRRQAL